MSSLPPDTEENFESPSLCEGAGDMPLMPTAVWVGSYLTALLLQKYLVLPDALRIAIALIPMIPFVFFVRRFIAHLRKLDELHRRVHFEALAFAFPLAILLLMTLGLLERTQILNSEDWSSRQVWFYLPFFYLVGLAIAWRRYR